LRLFIAVDLSSEVVSHARRVVEKLQGAPVQVRWVDTKNMHLTLHFFGDVDELEMPAICNAMDEVGAETAPFDVEVGGVGAFPNLHHPRTLWLGIRRGGDDLVALQKLLETRLRALGHPGEDRLFKPHLTVGRVRENPPDALAALAKELAALSDVHAGVTDVCDLTLYQSTPGREGPTYEALHTADLKGSG
jgi:2'-5' RNA ligase